MLFSSTSTIRIHIIINIKVIIGISSTLQVLLVSQKIRATLEISIFSVTHDNALMVSLLRMSSIDAIFTTFFYDINPR